MKAKDIAAKMVVRQEKEMRVVASGGEQQAFFAGMITCARIIGASEVLAALEDSDDVSVDSSGIGEV